MDLYSLVAERAPGNVSRGLAALALGLLLAAPAGCRDGGSGTRPTDAAVEVTPDLSEKLPSPDVYCSPTAPGGGSCPINFCGTPKTVASLVGAEMAQLGADEICTPGYVCIPSAPTADGKALQLRCVEPLAGAVAFGAACEKGGAAVSRCKDDTLCIEAPGVAGAFCSQLCRSDRDCPADAYCLERASAAVGTSHVNLAYCTPKAKLTATPCANEAACAAGQGCLSYGLRTELLTCQAGGTKSLGAACTADAECRSKECFDRQFRKPATGQRAYCSARCKKSSDCAPDQRCTRIVLGVNGTPADPFDDVVAGYCQSLFVPVAASGCTADGDCAGTGGDTCDTAHGLCFKTGAPSGAACTTDQACALGAVCLGSAAKPDNRYPGGYCQTLGCVPGQTTGVDSCPGGAEDTCVQRGVADAPLYGCYEGCTKSGDCSRTDKTFVCSPPTDAVGAAVAICLFNSGN